MKLMIHMKYMTCITALAVRWGSMDDIQYGGAMDDIHAGGQYVNKLVPLIKTHGNGNQLMVAGSGLDLKSGGRQDH